MSKNKKWSDLSQIALRIISIPLTEGACERVFSARRDIMTKHVSNIRDSVLEARAHLKAGLYQQIKEINKIKERIKRIFLMRLHEIYIYN